MKLIPFNHNVLVRPIADSASEEATKAGVFVEGPDRERYGEIVAVSARYYDKESGSFESIRAYDAKAETDAAVEGDIKPGMKIAFKSHGISTHEVNKETLLMVPLENVEAIIE